MAALPASIGDIRFRHHAGESDFPGLSGTYNAARLADGLSGVETLEEFTNQYTHLTNCDLARDLIVAEDAAGVIVGYGRTTWWVEEATDDRTLLAILFLRPEARGRGVAGAMLDWLENRLGEVVREHPHPGGEYLTAYVDRGEDERLGLVAARGYAVHRTYAEMTRPLSDPIPDVPLPAGLTIRPCTWDDARAVWEADDRAFQDHAGYSRQTETDYERWKASHYGNPALWKVAFAGDTIAGQVLNYVNAEENERMGRLWGYTESISVQREWRRRGVARALITESMRMWRDAGMEYAALGVHTANPNGAFGLYEGLGYRITGMTWEYRRPLGR